MAEATVRGAEFNIEITQGSNADFAFTFKDDLGVAIDITGYTVRSQIRKTPSGRISQGCTAVTQIVDGPNGVFSVSFQADDTANLSAGLTVEDPDSLHYWDIELEQPDGKVIPMVYGTVKVFREITKVT